MEEIANVAKVIFSDVNDKSIKVSFVGKKKIFVHGFNGKFECRIIDENNNETLYKKDVRDIILQSINENEYVKKGHIIVEQTERINVPKMNYSAKKSLGSL